MIEKKTGSFEDHLKQGNFVVTSEFGPPKGVDIVLVEKKIDLLKGHVIAANISDLQGANLSMGGIAAAHILKEKGLEPILQITCRDRNRLALQSEALDAYVMGIKNILVLTGDYPTIGDHPQSRPVFDLDSVQLIWTLSKLEEGYDLAGNKLTTAPYFFKGAAIKPETESEESFELQLIKMKKKVQCGAQFFQTMPVFVPEKFFKFIERVKKLDIKVPILAGIQLLKSEKMALYMNNFIPGIKIPDDIIDKMASATDKVTQSIKIASWIIKEIKPFCSGIHVGAQGWEQHVPTLLDKL